MVKVKFDCDAFIDKVFDFAGIKNIYEDNYIGHYTDINGLKGMLDDGGMRLCHFGYMNDPDDSVYLINALKKEIHSRLKGSDLEVHALNVLRVDSSPFDLILRYEINDNIPNYSIERRQDIYFEILKILNSYRDGMYKMKDLPSIYIGSFINIGKKVSHSGAVHSEGINAWRTYGNDGAGYRIDFCVADLVSNVRVSGGEDAVDFYPIRYMSESKISKFSEKILNLIHDIIIDNGKLSYDSFIDLMVDINYNLWFISSLIKSNHYEQEGEIRCVYLGAVKKNNTSHYIRGDQFVPYVKMKFNNKKIISNIICGPVVSQRSVYSLIDFIKSKKYKNKCEDWLDFIVKSRVSYKRKEIF